MRIGGYKCIHEFKHGLTEKEKENESQKARIKDMTENETQRQGKKMIGNDRKGQKRKVHGKMKEHGRTWKNMKENERKMKKNERHENENKRKKEEN